jgi:hypothetical protein
MGAIAPPRQALPAPQAQIVLAALAKAAVGASYSASLGAVYRSGVAATATWLLADAGTLPPGAAVSASGVLTATFAAPAVCTFTVSLTLAASGIYPLETLTRALTVEAVNTDGGAGRAINVALAAIPDAQLNIVYATSLGAASVTGTSPPTPSWAIANAGNLPVGYTLSSTGLLTATFTVAGAVSFVVRVSATGAAPVEKGITLDAVATGGSAGNPTAPTAPPTTAPTPPAPVFETVAEVGTEWMLVTHTLTDDGRGFLQPTQDSTGTVNYDTGVLVFPPEIALATRDWSSARTNGTGDWRSATLTDTFANGAQITVRYRPDSVTPTAASQTLPAQPLVIDLAPYTSDAILPGSVQFQIGSTIYQDFEGAIQHTVDPQTGVGTAAGTMDYGQGRVTLTDWVTGSATFTLLSLATYRGQHTETEILFRTAGSPLRPAGFQVATTAVDGALLTGAADVNGVIVGSALEGTVDVEFGLVELRFGEEVLDSGLTAEEKLEEWYDPADVVGGLIWQPRPVIPSTIRYNAVVYAYLPLSASLLGLNPVRLPMDGRVPYVRLGDSAAIHHTGTITLPNPVSGGHVTDCGRTRLARVWLTDAADVRVAGEKYTADLDAGIVTMAASLDLSAYTQPLTIHHLIVDEALVTGVDISGRVTLGRALSHDFPLGSFLSTEWRIGDLGARVTTPFAQQAWTAVWSDTLIGATITPKFSHALYPLVVTNEGAAQERWRIQFVSATNVHLIGETLGQLTPDAAPVSILAEMAPLNPVTGQPYFTIPAAGWGSGWVSGNLLRFNTFAADYPLWLLRCVQPGPASGDADRLSLEFLGDVDA